jgi:hypothetical protein
LPCGSGAAGLREVYNGCRNAYRTGYAMKKLPVGIQAFSKIIEGGYVYADKT